MKAREKFMAVVFFLFVSLVWSQWFIASLQAQAEPFYKGKSIRIVVGYTTGGFYDRWARVLARHLPKHIPGSPDIIVQNMPGAGSVIAANYIYNIAKPDGLTLGMASPGLYLDQLVGRKEVQFDVRKFVYIGSPVTEPMLMYMRTDAPYKSISDIRYAKEPPKCGSTGTVSFDYIFSRLLEDALPPLKIHTVVGYPAPRSTSRWRGVRLSAALSPLPHSLLASHSSPGRKITSSACCSIPDGSGIRGFPIPRLFSRSLKRRKVTEASRRVAEVILATEEFGRPMVGPPGTPADRLKILRAAYERSMKDAELLEEAKKGRMDMDPTSGEELEKLANRVLDQPLEVLERVKKILK